MIGILLEQRLKDTRRLVLISKALVGGHGRDVERQRVENPRFYILGVLGRHALHRLFVGDRARTKWDGLPILEKCVQSGDVVALTLTLGANALRFGRRGRARF